MSQAHDNMITDLFACTYDASQTKPLPVVAIPQPASDVVTYGRSFEIICQNIAKAIGDVTMTDYNFTADKSITVDGCLRIRNVGEVLHLDKVSAKVLIIDNCAEVHIGEVQCDHIAVQQSKKIALGNIDAENLLAYKCVDVTVAEFRVQYGILQSHRIHLGDGSTRKTSVLSDVLFIEGYLDRMSNWYLYSPIVHLGPMVPLMRVTNRLRLYANADSQSGWEETYGRCNLKKIIASAAKVFSGFNGTIPTFTEKEKDLINGAYIVNSVINLLLGGDTTTPMSSYITMAKTGMDLLEAERSAVLEAVQGDDDVSVFTMISPVTERRVTFATPTMTAPGQATFEPIHGMVLPDGGVPLEIVDPALLMNAGMVQVSTQPQQQPTTIHTAPAPAPTTQGNKTARAAAAAKASKNQQANDAAQPADPAE